MNDLNLMNNKQLRTISSQASSSLLPSCKHLLFRFIAPYPCCSINQRRNVALCAWQSNARRWLEFDNVFVITDIVVWHVTSGIMIRCYLASFWFEYIIHFTCLRWRFFFLHSNKVSLYLMFCHMYWIWVSWVFIQKEYDYVILYDEITVGIYWYSDKTILKNKLHIWLKCSWLWRWNNNSILIFKARMKSTGIKTIEHKTKAMTWHIRTHFIPYIFSCFSLTIVSGHTLIVDDNHFESPTDLLRDTYLCIPHTIWCGK